MSVSKPTGPILRASVIHEREVLNSTKNPKEFENALRKYLSLTDKTKDYTSILEDIFKEFDQWGFNIPISEHPWPIQSILQLPPEVKSFILNYKKRTSPPDVSRFSGLPVTNQPAPDPIQFSTDNAVNDFRTAFPGSQLIVNCIRLVGNTETRLKLLLDKISDECFDLKVSKNLENSLKRHFTNLWLAVHDKVLDSTSIAEGLSSELHSVSESLKAASTAPEIIVIIEKVIDRLNLLGYNTTELENDIRSFERLNVASTNGLRPPSNLLGLNEHYMRLYSSGRR